MTMLKPWQQALKEEIERTYYGSRVTFRRRRKLVNPPYDLRNFVMHWRIRNYKADMYIAETGVYEVKIVNGEYRYHRMQNGTPCELIYKHYATRNPPARSRGMPMIARL